MKTKELVLTFSYNQIMKEWVEGKDYRLPTLEEAKLLDYSHDEIWIQSDDISETHGILYNKKEDKLYKASRSFGFHAILIKDVDVVIEWGVSSKMHNTLFKYDTKNEALQHIRDEIDETCRLVKITREYYR